MKEKKGGCFGFLFFALFCFDNANEKEEESQGGCARNVLDISVRRKKLWLGENPGIVRA